MEPVPVVDDELPQAAKNATAIAKDNLGFLQKGRQLSSVARNRNANISKRVIVTLRRIAIWISTNRLHFRHFPTFFHPTRPTRCKWIFVAPTSKQSRLMVEKKILILQQQNTPCSLKKESSSEYFILLRMAQLHDKHV